MPQQGWNYFGAIILVVVAGIFRKQIIRVILAVLMRILSAQRYKNVNGAIREFEKFCMHPLSWVLFIVSLIIGLKIIKLESNILFKIVYMILGIFVLWSVIQFCTFLNIIIVRYQGWERSTSKDDSSKIMIVTEVIGLAKYVFCAIVFYYFFFNQLDFNTTEVFTTMVLLIEVLFVLSSHSWFRNVMGGLILLIDEPIKSGSHVHILGHEGVVEHMYLQYFTLRQYDKGLTYIPNSVVFNNIMDVRKTSLDTRFSIDIHFNHDTTKPKDIRNFLRNADHYLSQNQHDIATVSLATPDLSKTKLALTDIIRNHLAKKDSTQVTVPARFWVTVTALYTVQIVYYLPSTHKFRHLISEKRKLILGITRLIHTMKMQLHDPRSLPNTTIDPFTDDELTETNVPDPVNEIPHFDFKMPPPTTSIRRRTNISNCLKQN